MTDRIPLQVGRDTPARQPGCALCGTRVVDSVGVGLRRQLLALAVVLAMIGAGLAANHATRWHWFAQSGTRLSNGSWSDALKIVGVVGAFAAIRLAFASRLGDRIFNVLLSAGAIGCVVVAGVTFQPQSPFEQDYWHATGWYWGALATTITWGVLSLLAAFLLRRPAQPPFRWLLSITRRDEEPARTRVTLALVAALAATLALITGAVGPWQTTALGSWSGLDSPNNDAMIILPIAFLALLGLLAYWRLGSRRAAVGVVVLGTIAAIGTIYDIHRYDQGPAVSAWGLNLAAEASVTLAVFSLCLLLPARSLITGVRRAGLSLPPARPDSAAATETAREPSTRTN